MAFAGGAGPDVFNVDSFSSGQYYSSGILAPVDLAAVDAKSNGDLEKRYGLGIGGATYNGKIYGFPTEVSNWACVANKELWAKAGLDPAKDAPKTWEDMVDVATKLTVRDAKGVPYDPRLRLQLVRASLHVDHIQFDGGPGRRHDA